jgi:hypothetical protein
MVRNVFSARPCKNETTIICVMEHLLMLEEGIMRENTKRHIIVHQSEVASIN